MNAESKFGFKDSLATAVILVLTLVPGRHRGIVRGADARTGRSSEVMEKADGFATVVQKMSSISVKTWRRVTAADMANAARVESPASL